MREKCTHSYCYDWHLLCSRLYVVLISPFVQQRLCLLCEHWWLVCLFPVWQTDRGLKATFVMTCCGRRMTGVLKHALLCFFFLCVCTIQGHYCDSRPANVSLPRPCLKGHYCPAGTASPEQHPCPRGTFNPRQRAHSLADCVLCAAGQYCPSVGLSEPAGAMSHLLLMYSSSVKFSCEDSFE